MTQVLSDPHLISEHCKSAMCNSKFAAVGDDLPAEY